MTNYCSEGLSPVATLAGESKDLVDLIISEKDPNKLQDLTNLFKQNQLKKNLLRSNKLNNLLELIDDEVIMRVSSNPDLISDRDLLSYMNTTQQAIRNSYTSYEQLPAIQINNIENSVNISSDKLSKESRNVVMSKVKEILSQLNNDVIDVEDEDA